MIAKAKQSPAHTYYAVFDFDNTTAFLDIEEAVMIYQLEHLLFAMTPQELKSVIFKDIPAGNFSAEFNNKTVNRSILRRSAPIFWKATSGCMTTMMA